MKKQRTPIKKISSPLLMLLLLLFCGLQTNAQDDKSSQKKSMGEIENTQDKIEDLTVKVYETSEDYPDFKYTYNFDKNGNLTSVTVIGINDNIQKEKVEKYLKDLEALREEIKDMPTRTNVYYVTETLPQPKKGYEEFYDEIYSNLEYPERAKEEGIEGTVYVGFVVGEEGDILYASAKSNIQTEDYNNEVAKEMKKEAVKAVKSTSGEWIPGKIGDIPVAEWRMLPVQFKLKNPTFPQSLLYY